MDNDHAMSQGEGEEASGPRKPGDLTLLTKAKARPKTPIKRAKGSLRAAVTTSSSSSLEQARLRRASLPLTPDGESVVKQVKRFKDLEEALNRAVAVMLKAPVRKPTKLEKELEKANDKRKQEKTHDNMVIYCHDVESW